MRDVHVSRFILVGALCSIACSNSGSSSFAFAPPAGVSGGSGGSAGQSNVKPGAGGQAGSPQQPTAGAAGATGGTTGIPDAGSDVEIPKPQGFEFPKGFLFGAAIAGFQVDMGCPTLAPSECNDPHSDWYVFTTTPDLIRSDAANLSGQDPAVVGPGFWEFYKDDLRRAQEELHHSAFRMSLEWSRLFPKATDALDTFEELKQAASAPALQRYHEIFAELKRRNLRPLVTLYHYSLPTWLHDAAGCHKDFNWCSPRGWVDRTRAVKEAKKYAAFAAREFGAEVDWWATLNEPLQNMLFGYVQPTPQRTHPPAVSLKTAEAKLVFHALIEAHARMYDAVKAEDTVDADGDGKPSFVGVVYPFVPVHPKTPGNDRDEAAAKDIDYLWNRAYLRAVALGQFDEHLDGQVRERADLKDRMDYIGVNWYTGLKVGGLGFSVLPGLSPKFTANPLAFEEIANQPDKLPAFLHYVNKELGLPAVITETGVDDSKDDGAGVKHLVQNLNAVATALREGADVRGFLYWTLMDNYEWNHGMDIRMGLYAVDGNDWFKKRVARKTVPIFGEIARTNVLPDAFVAKYR